MSKKFTKRIRSWVRFAFVGKESGTAILAVFSRAGSPCHVVENNLPTKMNRTRIRSARFCKEGGIPLVTGTSIIG
jgi:hypothetical protein